MAGVQAAWFVSAVNFAQPPLHELGRQVSMIGFVDAFWMVTLSFPVLALLFRRKPGASDSGAPLSG